MPPISFRAPTGNQLSPRASTDSQGEKVSKVAFSASTESRRESGSPRTSAKSSASSGNVDERVAEGPTPGDKDQLLEELQRMRNKVNGLARNVEDLNQQVAEKDRANEELYKRNAFLEDELEAAWSTLRKTQGVHEAMRESYDIELSHHEHTKRELGLRDEELKTRKADHEKLEAQHKSLLAQNPGLTGIDNSNDNLAVDNRASRVNAAGSSHGGHGLTNQLKSAKNQLTKLVPDILMSKSPSFRETATSQQDDGFDRQSRAEVTYPSGRHSAPFAPPPKENNPPVPAQPANSDRSSVKSSGPIPVVQNTLVHPHQENSSRNPSFVEKSMEVVKGMFSIGGRKGASSTIKPVPEVSDVPRHERMSQTGRQSECRVQEIDSHRATGTQARKHPSTPVINISPVGPPARATLPGEIGP